MLFTVMVLKPNSSSQQVQVHFLQESGGNLKDLLYFDATLLTHQAHRCLQAKHIRGTAALGPRVQVLLVSGKRVCPTVIWLSMLFYQERMVSKCPVKKYAFSGVNEAMQHPTRLIQCSLSDEKYTWLIPLMPQHLASAIFLPWTLLNLTLP